MSSQPRTRLTPEQYLEIERAATFKSEYYDGQMFAMSGASFEHDDITGNLSLILRRQLRHPAPCKVSSSDVRVFIPATRVYTYPDLTVVCGPREHTDDHVDTLLNPTLIVEVLSPSTEAYDRGRKFEQYRTIPSLRQYLLVAQDRTHVDLYTRRAEGWTLKSSSERSSEIVLESIGCTLPLSELYEGVDVP